MFSISVKNVNHALHKATRIIQEIGTPIDSRNGPTLEMCQPFCTTYERPWERVLINKTRDAHPFFHLFESLWILQGRRDVAFLSQFVKRIADYSDDGENFNAPYGWRMQHAFMCDQVEAVINILREDINSRQAVIQIWSVGDLERQTKDKACNMQVIFRVRRGRIEMTVYNRSNDMLWGAYGANVVQFSMLHEYVAAVLDIPMGMYHQVSNAFHVYTDGPGGELWNKIKTSHTHSFVDPYRHVARIVRMDSNQMGTFNNDLSDMFEIFDRGDFLNKTSVSGGSDYFHDLVCPMWRTWQAHRNDGPLVALKEVHNIRGDDWRIAAKQWLENRI